MNPIPITTSKQLVYTTFLKLVKDQMAVLSTLKNKEIEVLGQIMYSHDEFSSIKEEHRWTNIMSTENKAKMRERLGLEDTIFNNYLSILRRKKVLHKNKHTSSFTFLLKGDIDVTFKIKTDEGQ